MPDSQTQRCEAGPQARVCMMDSCSSPYMKQKRLWEMIAKIDGFWQAFPPRLKDPTALDKMDRDLIAAMWTLFA